LFQHDIFSTSQVGIHVVNLRTKEEVFGFNADEGMVPASVMKAITSAAALRVLGANFAFETKFFIDGKIRDGVLEGDLYIKGGGDPSLEVHHLWKIAHDLKARGIGRITGNVYYDNTIFDGDQYIPGWNKSVDIANGPSYFPKTSGLSLNYNCVAIRVRAGDKPKEKASVFIEYPSSDITIVNELKTVKSYARPRVSLSRSIEKDAMEFTLSGQVPLGKEWTYYRAIHSPSKYFVSQFVEVLKHNKILINGLHSFQEVPADLPVFYRFRSASIGTLIKTMNKYSQNLFAENIFQMMGVQRGQPASEVVKEYLVGLGVGEDSVVIQNGSGLSRDISLSASAISLVFSDMYESKYVGAEYIGSLSVAGLDGTLRKRFREEDTIGKIRGKTGSLNWVFCVGGLVFGHDGDTYSLVILMNELKSSSVHARTLQDSFLDKLIRSPDVNK
jgi:D-alanyl-D-alanine carboxypeptidase/D-alanyl-D-alanine-endopeptidase (penicillin-binding protein 4)